RQVEIGGLPAYVTDYTYTYNGEARVGVVIALYVPSQNVGYAFDLDAPANNPAPAQQALQALVGSINFFDVGAMSGASAWQTVTVADGLLTFPVPANWTPDQSDGWTLYEPVGDEAVFVAAAAATATGLTNADLAQSWVT